MQKINKMKITTRKHYSINLAFKAKDFQIACFISVTEQ
jgi:hypothetical protein